MRILIIAATLIEIQHITKLIEEHKLNPKYQFEVCITGIGLMACTYQIMKSLQGKSIDMLLQLGIAGSFDYKLALGQVVAIKSEAIADLGAEKDNLLIDFFELGFLNPNEFPYIEKKLVNNSTFDQLYLNLPFVSSISVNSVSGSQNTIETRKANFDVTVENMEGAALHFIGLKENIPFLQVRSISNYVELRNTDKWNIPLALNNLEQWFYQTFKL